jgi:hypothetical protein
VGVVAARLPGALHEVGTQDRPDQQRADHDLDPVRRDVLAELQRLLDAADEREGEHHAEHRPAAAEYRDAAEHDRGDGDELEALPDVRAAVELRSEMTTPASAATVPDMTKSHILMRLTRMPEKRAASSLAPIA